MGRRVVITAVGVISPTGRGFDAVATALRGGVSGGVPVSLFDASTFPTRIAAEVSGFDAAAPLERLGRERGGVYDGDIGEDRKTALGLAAAWDLFDQTGPLAGDVALHLGTGLSSASVRELEADLVPFTGGDGSFDDRAYGAQCLTGRSTSPWRHLTDEANRLICSALDISGPSSSSFAACAASTHAIGRAFRDVASGRVDRAVAGGMDSMVHPFGMISFMRLGALSTANEDPATASRPFDRDRDGFLLGEGAVLLLLETLEAARARGARPLGEVVGYGTSMDAHAVTAPHPEGRGAYLAMERALGDAGMSAAQVGYVNAHGTGTPLNDGTEARAVSDLWAAQRAAPPPMSSTKSMTGHLIAAAGALEAVACLAGLGRGFLPPSINIQTLDPAIDVPVVDAPTGPDFDLRVAMTNSFGFGGQNGSLILSRWEGA